MQDPRDITILLQKVHLGEAGAKDELFSRVYDELHRAAGRLMRGEKADHTLQPTALVHEVWLQLLGATSEESQVVGPEWTGQAHFLRAASRSMRNLLVDHARAKRTDKRGGRSERMALDDIASIYEERGIDVLPLDEAMNELEKMDGTLARLVELKFFGGLTNKEAASVLDVSLSTCERGWLTARAFLRKYIGENS